MKAGETHFRWAPCLLAILLWGQNAALAQTSQPEPIQPLKPPKPLIAPTYWEEHRMLILVASAAGLAVLAGGLWAGLRPRPTASEPPAQAALRQLDELARVPAQGPVLSRISRTVREYVTSAFNLPREEATTKEFVGRLQAEPSLGQQLIAQLPEFLRACDERKFSPNPPLGDFDAVGKARALIAAGEKQRAQLAAEKSAEAKPPTA